MLKKVLLESQIDTTVKLHAIIAIGDIAMITSNKFMGYMPDIMKAFADASVSSFTIGDNDDDIKLFSDLRQHLVEGYTSKIGRAHV